MRAGDAFDEKQKVFAFSVVKKRRWITSELTGRRDFIQPSIQSIKLRNTLPPLRSNELL